MDTSAATYPVIEPAPGTEGRAPWSEARHVLTDLAERGGAGALAQAFADRALAVTRGADFAVTRDALDALLRRLDSSLDDGLVVRRVAGGYRVGGRGKQARVYDVWLAQPGVASCSCPDFGKAALGLCKHILAATRDGQGTRRRSTPARALRWDPIRPLTGPGDWLARVWHDPRVALPPALGKLFQRASEARPIDPAATAAVARRRTVEALLEAIRRDPLLAEPALASQLERERADLDRRWAIEPRELARLVRGLKQKLFPYQRDGVARFLAAGRLLLADDMGLGKTAQAIASCHALFAAGKIRRALVVVPAPLKPQWAREWLAFTDLPLVTVDGHPDERAALYRRRGDGALLVNYEQLLRDLPAVQRYAPELVILDEAQRIKNWETKTAAVVKRLAPTWRLVLTGTPMENRLDELASIMEWVDEHALEPRWRLAHWHTMRSDGRREVIGARNLETLRARLAPSMLRRIRSEVLAQLPPRRDLRISVALTEGQQAAHMALEPLIAALMRRAENRPLTQAEFLRLMQLLTRQRMICNGLALHDFVDVWPGLERTRRRTEAELARLDSPKLLELRSRLADLVVTQQRKVVVFSQWRRMLKLAAWVIADVVAEAGVRFAFFTGDESQRRRTENLVAFHDDPSMRILFATDAGGVGLNLQRAASCCINLELPWNPAVLEQRIGRIFRLGQTQPVEIYNLVAATGIEDRIAGLVGSKRALFTGLFDGTSDEVPFDAAASFMTRIRQITQPAGDGSGPVASTGVDGELDDAPDAASFDGEPEEIAEASSRASAQDAALAALDEARVALEAATAVMAAPVADAAGAGPAVFANPSDGSRPAADPWPPAASLSTTGAAPDPDAPPEAGLAPVAPARAIQIDPATPSATSAPVSAPIEVGALAAMLSQIELRPLDDGRVSLALPRPAAAALGGVLRALAAAVEAMPAG